MLLSSVRNTRDFIDVNRLSEVVEIFKIKHHYRCLADKQQYTYYPANSNGKHPKLEDICSLFTYPPEILDFIINLNCNCSGFVKNFFKPHEEDCSLMDRWPILRASQIKYQVLRLRR